MKKYNLKRFLASLLAVLMLASVTGVSPAVFADWGDSARAGIATTAAKSGEKIVLNDSEFKIRIPYKNGSVDYDALYQTIFDTCVNVSQSTPKSRDQVDIGRKFSPGVYGALEGATILGKTYGSIEEDETYEVKFTHKYGKYSWDVVDATCKITFLGREAAPFTVAVPQEGVSLVFNNDASLNYAAIEDAIRALVTSSDESLAPSNITVKYDAALTDITDRFKPLNNTQVGTTPFGEGTFKIELTWAGNDQYKPFEWTGDISFTDNRIATNIAIRENASITYNVDKDAMKKDIFNNVIDWAASTPTDKTALTYENFKFEYKGKDLADAKLNADEKNPQDITISYSGDANSKPCNNVTASVIVKKANVKVSMNMFTKAYAGVEEDLSKEALGVTLTPDDKAIDIYMVFAGVNTNFDGSINLVLTDEQWAFIKKFSALEREIYDFVSKINPEYKNKPTLEDKLTDGITTGEFKQYVNDAVNALKVVAKIPGVDDILKKYNIDIDSIAAMVSIFTELDFADDTTIAFGVPKHAGMYRAYAIAVNKNYEPNYATGTVLILMNVKNVKIVMNEKFSSKMDAATAAEVAKAPASLQHNGVTVKDQSSLHYLYTGIQSNLKPYQSTTDFPTEPGRYVVTVVTLGGDYLASPVTRSFQITK